MSIVSVRIYCFIGRTWDRARNGCAYVIEFSWAKSFSVFLWKFIQRLSKDLVGPSTWQEEMERGPAACTSPLPKEREQPEQLPVAPPTSFPTVLSPGKSWRSPGTWSEIDLVWILPTSSDSRVWASYWNLWKPQLLYLCPGNNSTPLMGTFVVI